MQGIPDAAREALRRSWAHLHGGTLTGGERDLNWLLVSPCFPMSLPSASDARYGADGHFDHVSHARLGQYIGNAHRIAEPRTLLRIANSINDAIVLGAAEFHGLDVVEFLGRVDARAIYLDPPYGGTESLVSRHRRVERLVSVPCRHYRSVATAERSRQNREFLVREVR